MSTKTSRKRLRRARERRKRRLYPHVRYRLEDMTAMLKRLYPQGWMFVPYFKGSVFGIRWYAGGIDDLVYDENPLWGMLSKNENFSETSPRA